MSGSTTEAPALPANLVELLLELAIGVHRYGIYPSDHPTVIALGDRLARRINDHTERQGTLTVGVADGQMLVGDAATDPTHAILSDFARKAKDRGIGGFALLPSLGAVDIELLLEALASEPSDDGLLPQMGTERIRLFPPGYDRLQLADGDSAAADPASRANDLWFGLARSAISNGAIENGDATDISGLAGSVQGRMKEDGGSRLMLGYMAQLAGVLAEDSVEDSSQLVRGQFANLIEALDPSTLRELLQKGGGNDTNIRFALDVCRSLDPATAVKVLEAIPKQEGRRISHQLVRLLRKMSLQETNVPANRKQHAVDTFREAVERISDEWKMDSEDGPRSGSAFSDAGDLDVLNGDAENARPLSVEMRILWISLEVGMAGAALRASVETLAESPEISFLLSVVDAAPADHPVAEFVRSHLKSGHLIGRLVNANTGDPEVLQSVIDRAGLAAVEPLIEALISSPSRSVRRLAFDRLEKIGMPAGLAAVTRLDDQPWYVLRNLLVLAQCLRTLPSGVNPLPLMFHADVRVRKEAFPVCLKVADGSTTTLKAALDDEDERMVELALKHLATDLPGFLVPDVVAHLEEKPKLALEALAGSESPLALKALIDVCVGKRILRGSKLNKKSPALLRAIRALREKWNTVDEARTVLVQAALSRDPEVRAAAKES